METLDSVLHFWFGDAADDASVIRERSDLWWSKEPIIDEEIRRRFGALLDSERQGEWPGRSNDPRAWLARILLLDQFPRNIYRGTPQAFAYDQQAKALTHVALAAGMDARLRPVERVFLYMPLEHSERSEDQAQAVKLFTALYDQVPREQKALFQVFLDFASRHKAIIDRFGRFPHRNAILGRRSTPDERAFLETPGSSF